MINAMAFLLLSSASCFAADSTDLVFESWVSAGLYGSHYSTSRGKNEFHDLLNFAPGDNIGLNNIYLGARATSSTVFGAVTLQYGDIPRSGGVRISLGCRKLGSDITSLKISMSRRELLHRH